MSGERTERATPRKRQKAREKGDRVRSREIVAASAMVAGVLTMGTIFPGWAKQWRSDYQSSLTLGASAIWESESIEEITRNIRQVVIAMLSPLLVLSTAVGATALLVSIVQGNGLAAKAEALQPKWERINPLNNLKNLVSLRGVARLAKSLLPAVPFLILAIRRFKEQSEIAAFSTERLAVMWSSVYFILLDAGCVLFLWSVVDFLVEWRSWESRQKMSKQEIKDEYRETEGNPQIRSRIRSLRRQLRRRRLRADVNRASVVITNPTHYAVALSFDFETMEAPRVLAKGRNLVAEQIKNEARWAGVPVIENPPLARSLYRLVETGQAIPLQLYAAVAAILAYLYRQQVEERVRRERIRERAAAGATAKPGSAAFLKEKS